jgi:predicted PurR-regulated permease PerM
MMERKNATTLVFLGFTAVSLYLCYLLFRPYLTPILFALVIAIVFYPLHRYTQRICRGPTLGALMSTLATLLLTVVPLTFLLLALSNELTNLYHGLTVKSAGSGGVIAYLLRGSERITAWASRYMPVQDIDVRAVVLSRLENISSSLLHYGANLVGNLFSLATSTVIALIVLFFLFRDGERLLSRLMAMLPSGQDRVSELLDRVKATVATTFYGGFAIGALQGTLTGLSFWALGIDSPILWGMAAAVFSLVPFFGSAIVWVPASIVLLFTGHPAKGIILLVLGTTVIGTVDNILRPIIIHKRVRLHPVLVFFSILGGLQVFGVLGLFVGPVILSVTAALLEMVQKDAAGQSVRPASDKSPDVQAGPAPGKASSQGGG